MPKSLKCKLSSLRYKRLLTDEEYKELIQKLEGHDREIRNKAIDKFAEALYKQCDSVIESEWNNSVAPISWAKAYEDFKDDIYDIAEQMKGGVE